MERQATCTVFFGANAKYGRAFCNDAGADEVLALLREDGACAEITSRSESINHGWITVLSPGRGKPKRKEKR